MSVNYEVKIHQADQLAHLDLLEHDSSPRTVPERPQSVRGDRLKRTQIGPVSEGKTTARIGSASPALNYCSAPGYSHSSRRRAMRTKRTKWSFQ